MQQNNLKHSCVSSNIIRNDWQLEEIMDLFKLPFNDLILKAANIHKTYFPDNEVQISTLLSIKTGSCPEDCKYCPQSAHYKTNIEKESLLDTDFIVQKAIEAKKSGATRFCMGAAWRNVNDRDLPKLKDIIGKVKNLNLETCVTLGMANKEQLSQLKDSGLDYYNHNIDTSEEYYDKIISTRKFKDRIDTLKNISDANLKTCCGGIVGLGETLEDRAKMLQTLANLDSHPESVPINKLVKVKNTPLENNDNIDDFDFIKTIAVARILMPKSYVRLSAGRENMNEQTQAFCFLAGANSIFYGEKLLTTKNPEQENDNILFEKLGIKKQNK